MTSPIAWMRRFSAIFVVTLCACVASSDSTSTVVRQASIVVEPPSQPADGISQMVVTVDLGNVDGTTVENINIRLATDAPGVTLSQPGPTDARGIARGSMTASTPTSGTLRVYAGLGGAEVEVAGTAAFTFSKPVPPESINLTLTPHTLSAMADGRSAIAITLSAIDGNGDPLVGETVALTSNQSQDVLFPSRIVTDSLGTGTVLVSSIKAGIHVLTASLRSGSATTQIAFTPGSLGNRSQLLLSISDLEANGVSAAEGTVTARDDNGNPVPGASISVSSTDATDVITLSGNVTDADGEVHFSIRATSLGTKTIKATLGTLTLSQTLRVVAPSASSAASTLHVTPSIVQADGTSVATLTLNTKDMAGITVANVPVSFSISGGNNTLTMGAATDANGVLVGTLVSTQAEVKNVVATLPQASVSATVTYVAGPPSPTRTTLTALPATVAANGSASTTLSLVARDAYGNVTPNKSVTLSVSGTANTLSRTTGTTDAAGVLTATLRSTHAETKTVTAALSSTTVTTTVNFTADASQVAATLSASPNVVVADGSSNSTLTVVLVDVAGNPVSGAPVSFAGTNIAFAAATGTTDVSGRYRTTATSTVAGVGAITVTAGGTQATTNVTFKAGAAASSTSTVTASPNTVTANGVSASTLTVVTRDAFSNIVPNQAVTLSASGSSNTLGATSGTTNASGSFVTSLRSPVAESKTVLVTASGASFNTAVQFVAGPMAAANSTFTAAPTTVAADGVTQATLTLVAHDANNNKLVAVPLTFSATGSNNVLAPANTSTDTNGSATAVLKSTTAQIKTITANVGGVAISTPVTFVAGAPAGANTQITAAPSSLVANTSALTNLTVTVRDSTNNPVAGQAVTISSTGTGDTLYQPTPSTDANGIVTATLSSSTAGTDVVSATFAGITRTANVLFTAGPAVANKSTFVANPNTLAADGTTTTTLLVTAQDAYNNPVSGLTIAFGGTTTGDTLVPAGSTTQATGQQQATLKSTTVGAKDITATLNGFTLHAAVNFNASSPSSSTSSLTASPNTLVADNTALTQLTVRVRDAQNNPVPGATVGLSVAQGGTTLGTGSNTTDANGIYTTSLKSSTSGTKNVTATFGGATATTAVVFTAGTPVAGNSSIVASPNVVTADGSSQSALTILVRDALNNVVSAQSVAVSASGTGATIGATPLTTNASGTATTYVVSTKAETKTITATLSGGATVSTTVTFTAGTANSANSTFVINPNTAVADNTALLPLTVTLRDTQGNPVSGQTVTLTSGQAADVFTAASGATNSSGVYSTSVKSTLAGSRSITATAGGATLSANVTFTAGAPTTAQSTLVADSNTVTADNSDTATLTYSVRDAYSNPVPNQAVTLTSTGSNNTFTQLSAGKTNGSGIYAATLASSKAEVKTLTATAGAAVRNLNVTYVAGPVTTATSSIVASPNSQTVGLATVNLTVVAADAAGNRVANQNVVLGPNVATNTFSPMSGFTDATGTFTATLSATKAQAQSIQANMSGTTVQTTVTFNPNNPASPNTTFTSNNSQVTADGNSTAVLTVVARDGYGNLINNSAVLLTSSGTNNTFTPASGFTDVTGTFTATLKSTTVELKNLSAAVGNANGTTATTNVNFVAGSPNTQNITFTASPNVVIADNIQVATFTLLVHDNSANPVSGVAATFASVAGTNNTLSTTSGTTDASGTAQVTLRSTVAESKTLSATVGGANFSAQATFVAGNPNNGHSTFVSNPATVTADGTSAMTIVFTAKDTYDNLVSGAPVQFTAPAGPIISTGNSFNNTASDGTVTAMVTSTVANTFRLVPFVNYNSSNHVFNGLNVTFTAGAADANHSSFNINPNVVVADGVSTATVAITAKDVYDNGRSGQNVTLSYGGTATIATTPGATDSNGTYTATVRSTLAQTATLTANFGVTRSGPITFVAGAPAQAYTTLSASPNALAANGSSQATLTFYVADAQNNPVSGVPCTFSSSGGNNTLTPSSTTTNSAGVATAQLSSTQAQLKQVTGAVTSTSITANANVIFNAGSISAAQSSVVASPNSVTTDGNTTTTVTAVARDGQRNPVANQAVSLSALGTNNVFGNPNGITDASGTYSTTLYSNTAQVETLQADFAGQGIVTSSVTFTPGAPTNANSLLTASSTSPTVNSNVTLTFTAKDAHNNPVPGFAVTLASVDGSTDATGVFTTTLTQTTAGNVNYTATNSIVLGTPISKSVTINWQPGAASNVVVAASPNALVANNVASTTLTATVTDTYGNANPNQSVTFTSSGSANTFGTPTSTSNASGQVTSTLVSTKAEVKTVTATANGITGSTTVTFSAGPAVLANSSVVASPNQVVANGVSTAALTTTVRDAYNNPIGGLAIALSGSGSSNTFSPASGTTQASGVFSATVASTLVQNQNIIATGGGIAPYAPVVFLAGAANTTLSTFTASPNNVVADGVSTTTLRLTVRDAYNNPVYNQNVLISSPGTGNTPTSSAGFTDTAGVYTVSLKSTTAGNKSLTAAFGANSLPGSVTFVAGAATAAQSSWTASPSSVTTDNNTTLTLTLVARDAQNNPVGNQSVAYSASGSANYFAATTGTTAASTGIATVTLYSPLAQNENVIATFAGQSLSTPVSFVAGTPSSTGSSFTASPNTLTADGTAASTLTVTVRDAQANTIQNANVVLSTAGTNNTFGSLTGMSNASGVFTTTLRSTKAQSETINAALGNLATAPSVSALVTFTAGISSNATSTLTANPNSNTADGNSYITLTVTARDAYANPMYNAAVNLVASGGNNTFTPATGNTDVNGVWTARVTSTLAQSQNVTATISP